jgi:hypothetical protein
MLWQYRVVPPQLSPLEAAQAVIASGEAGYWRSKGSEFVRDSTIK